MAMPLVLVVDDDVLVRIDTVAILEEAGFEVIEARDVASAQVALHNHADVRLVCTDVHMPGDLNGIDLAVRVRSHHPQIAVIVMSGFTDARALPLGTPFLAKPFPASVLVDLAWEQLEAPGRRPLRRPAA